MSCKAILRNAALLSGALALCAAASAQKAQLEQSLVNAKPQVSQAPTFRQVAGNIGNTQFAMSVECDCTWENGVWDNLDGQTSETGTSVEDSRTADDFCLKEGYVYEITSISVQMLSNTSEPDATLQLYHDCNGCPSDTVDCGYFEQPTIDGAPLDLGGGWHLYTFVFNTGPRVQLDEYRNEVEYEGLWLKGGCYWASPVGIGDGTGYDRYFWGTAGSNLIGAIPKTQAGPFKIDGWERVDDLNVACRNFAFEVCSNPCCIIRDNGPASSDVSWSQDTTLPGCYNADNFVVSPCADIDLCFFSAYIYTNCDCTRSKIRIYEDDCGEVGAEHTAGYILTTKCIPLSGYGSANGGVDFGGQQLAKFRVEWHASDLANVPTLSAGDNYWIALEVQGSGSFNERGFWAFNENCENPGCTINISSGQYVCPANGTLSYTEIGHDYAFCLAGNPVELGAGTATTGCAADYNGDGTRSVADLLMFLDVWFEGCDN
jgi:hypothetical protein